MSTRRYTLGRRGEAADETRQRIVAATFALHAEQGVAATTMKQIAARAGVSVGAVYHHFPTYEDAIRGCGEYAIAVAPPPTAEIFAGIGDDLQPRVERLAQAAFEWFEQIPGFERVRCDQHLVPVLRPYVEAEEANRVALMQEALAPAGLTPEQARMAAALLDLSVYRGLRRAGLSCSEAARQITCMILPWVASITGETEA